MSTKMKSEIVCFKKKSDIHHKSGTFHLIAIGSKT